MNWIIEVLVDMIDPEVEYPAKRKESWHRYGIQMAHMRNRLYGTNYMNPIQVFLIISVHLDPHLLFCIRNPSLIITLQTQNKSEIGNGP